MKKLPISFYDRDDVVLIARELIGKVLCAHVDDVISKGTITETGDCCDGARLAFSCNACP